MISDSAAREAGWSGAGGVPEEEAGGGQRRDETQGPAGSQVSTGVSQTSWQAGRLESLTSSVDVS